MEVEDSITINEAYASKYEKKKRAEELSKLRDKYGDVGLDESDSSSSDEEEEDENAELLTAAVERDFLRTLSLIHSKDPSIYKEDTQFYHKEVPQPAKENEKKEKPMYLKDYEMQQLLERGAMAGVSDSEEEEAKNKERLPLATYREEQEQLKADFHQAVEEGRLREGKEEEETGGSLLTLRKKNQEEIEEEERDYILWLKGEKAKMAAGESDFSGLHSVWAAPDIDSGEAFLRDYILDRRFLDRDSIRPQVPTYDEIVGDSEDSEDEELQPGKRKKRQQDERREGGDEDGEEEVDVSEDEESLNRQANFERRYNFRFEEPGGGQITSYPRNVSGSVRREDDRRKEKRRLREERKERERELKEEELKRLKKLKRKEIKQKLEKIRSITGNPNVGFVAADLDGDFDPASYDEAMARAFDDYYIMNEGGGEGEGGKGEGGKPVFLDDDEVYDDWDEWQVDQEPHCEDPDFNMDADYDPHTAQVQSSSKSLKHRHKLAQAVSVKKPLFDPEEKAFEEYFDEYYHLDYEDIIGDLPCRFKYSQVPANSFGLSTEEVLACENKELNQWASLRKSVQIRTEEEEEKDRRVYKKKARNFKKKYQILSSLKESQEEQEQSRKRKHKTCQAHDDPAETHEQQVGTLRDLQEVSVVAGEVAGDEEDDGIATSSSAGKKLKSKSRHKKRGRAAEGPGRDLPTLTTKLKHRKKHKISSSAARKLSSARLKSYGL